nr:hypothetical protein [Candidatus Woesebacteria bacterium]
LIAVLGAIVFIIAAIYHYESESMFTLLFVILGILTLIYGLFLMVLTLTKNTALAATSWLKKLYGIKVDSHLKDWIMTVCVREAREAKGVSLLFLFMILGIGFLMGLFFTL